MTATLKVNVLIGLPGSGRTTWLHKNFKEETFFDNLNIGPEGLNDDDFERFGDLIQNQSIKEISISDVNFADAKSMFQTLDYLHTLIESAGREETYHFVLFPQSEAHCIRNVKEREQGREELPLIQKFAPIIKQTFIFIKNKFPRYVQEVSFSPLMEEKKNHGISENHIPKREVEMSIISDENYEKPIEPPKRQGFLSGLLRRS